MVTAYFHVVNTCVEPVVVIVVVLPSTIVDLSTNCDCSGQKDNNSANNGVGVNGGSSDGRPSCRGGTFQLLKELMEGRIL